MSDMSELTCALCGPQLERVRYFSRQLLTADDMTVEQEYFRQKLRRHNRYLHGFGVVCGYQVEAAPEAGHAWQVRVCPGYALAPQGDEILICAPVLFDLATGATKDEPCAPCPCPPVPQPSAENERPVVYLAIRYSECSTRPVRVHPAGCGCDDTACEYARIRDDFCLAVLWELPDCYKKTADQESAWLTAVLAVKQQGNNPLLVQAPQQWPVPDCPCCPDDPWVILARMRLPAKA